MNDNSPVRSLARAVEHNDLEQVKTLMDVNPTLHRAPLGYEGDGPLTLAAECMRLGIAEWMIENGSDVHQGGDGPLMRAALSGDRIPMMELLVRHGANVNAWWRGEYPIIFASCEAVDPAALQWLLDHGADPNCPGPKPGTALDYLIGSYVRSPQLGKCIDILLGAGATGVFNIPPVMEILRGGAGRLKAMIEGDPSLLQRRLAELQFGTTGGRMLTLRGATLLHVTAEYQNREAAELLLDHGSDVNAAAEIGADGVGGQTPLFHAVTQNDDAGLSVAKLFVARGADLTVRARVPGHYERPGEVLECTALGYAMHFEHEPVSGSKTKTVAWLRSLGAPIR